MKNTNRPNVKERPTDKPPLFQNMTLCLLWIIQASNACWLCNKKITDRCFIIRKLSLSFVLFVFFVPAKDIQSAAQNDNLERYEIVTRMVPLQ